MTLVFDLKCQLEDITEALEVIAKNIEDFEGSQYYLMAAHEIKEAIRSIECAGYGYCQGASE